MTPPLSIPTLTIRLTSMQQLLEDLRSAGTVDRAQLERDRMLRHGIERILTQLVDLAVDINGHIAAAHLRVPPLDARTSFESMVQLGVLTQQEASDLSRSVGLRNVLVHEYVRIDLDMVADATETALEQYSRYVAAVSQWLAAGPN